MMADNVEGDRGYSEELEGEVLDRGLRFPIGEEVRVDNSMIYACKMRGYEKGGWRTPSGTR